MPMSGWTGSVQRTSQQTEVVDVVVLRTLLGDALRERRLRQHRTLREVSGAARVSLGWVVKNRDDLRRVEQLLPELLDE